MPPRESELRQRTTQNKETVSKSDPNVILQSNHPDLPTKKLSELTSTEVCIHGKIYDLKGFVHPGGESVMIYGGNDVTAQYHMMHPYHTDKHLEKMRLVGIASDYTTEYEYDTEFEREIKREVFKIVRRGREFGTPGFFLRAAFYISFLAYTQYMWVTEGSSIKWALLLGLAQAWIGLNVQHDGNHGAASRNHYINDFLGLGASFIGGDKWLWMEQHTTHHAYCNHNEKDPDSFNAEPMMLFNDYPLDHPARKWYHNLQALYFLPLLSFYWLSMVFNPQVLDLRHAGAANIGMKFESDFVKSRRKYAIAIRLLYIYWNVVTPFYHHDPKTALCHILLMGATESLVLACLFALSHNFMNSDRDPTKEFREKGTKVCWFKAQVETSSTYGGAISGALTGGLNFQVEHHLFPRMSSAWYPYIAPTVREICKKHGVNYAYYPWIWQNFISTVRYMHRAGTGANWELLQPLSGKN
jgi:fatty acid desaturase